MGVSLLAEVHSRVVRSPMRLALELDERRTRIGMHAGGNGFSVDDTNPRHRRIAFL